VTGLTAPTFPFSTGSFLATQNFAGKIDNCSFAAIGCIETSTTTSASKPSLEGPGEASMEPPSVRSAGIHSIGGSLACWRFANARVERRLSVGAKVRAFGATSHFVYRMSLRFLPFLDLFDLPEKILKPFARRKRIGLPEVYAEKPEVLMRGLAARVGFISIGHADSEVGFALNP
jgi:hypothetical protein